MRAPAAILAIPLLVGSAAGLLAYEDTPSWLCLTTAAAGLLSLLAAVASVADEDTPLAVAAMAVSAACVGVSLGMSAAATAYSPPLLRWFDGAGTAGRASVSLTGVLREDAAVTPAGVTLAIDVHTIDREVTSGGVRLSVAGTLAGRSLHEWRAGRRLRLTASLRRPAVYRNPGVPDESRALARRGISLVGSVKSAALVEVTARGGWLDERAASLRAAARRRLAVTVGAWSQRSAGVATAILIGDRTGLSQDDERRLQDAGTYHVIAISGGNIAILTVLLLGLFRLGRVPPKWAAATCIALLLFYGRVTGPAPSVDRAIFAAVVFLSARLFELRGSSLNVLATAALCGVAVSPTAVLDPGFILSFGATLGILTGVSRLMATLDRGRLALRRVGRPPAMRWLVLSARAAIAVVAATVSAELVLAPVAAAMFGRVTAAGLVLNLVAIPMMTVVQGGALAALAGADLGPVAAGCGYVVHRAASWLIDSSRLVEAVPWVARDVAPPAWWLLGAYYAALLLAVLVAGHPNMRRAACLLAVVTGATIAAGTHAASRDGVPWPGQGALRVAILDVGQGDATLVQFPDGRALLVDAGGLPAGGTSEIADGPSFDIGDRVVARAIRAFGVRRLDTLVLTHGDPDHIGGAPAILRGFRPRAIWEGVPVPPHSALTALAGRGEPSERRMADDRRRRPDPPRRRRGRDAPSAPAGMGTAARPQRRLHRPRDPLSRRADRSAGRHRPRRGVRRRHRGASIAARNPEGRPPRQRDLDDAGVPVGGQAGCRHLQRRPRQPLWPPGPGRRLTPARVQGTALLDGRRRRRRRGDGRSFSADPRVGERASAETG